MFQKDPFSGHVVIRSTDADIAGARYRLWTTLKSRSRFRCKTLRVFVREDGRDGVSPDARQALVRIGCRPHQARGMEPGSKAEELAEEKNTEIVALSELEWRVLVVLKREFERKKSLKTCGSRAPGKPVFHSKNLLKSRRS
jgi:hypothetical protein